MRDYQPSQREELDQRAEPQWDEEAERKQRLQQRAEGILHEELGPAAEADRSVEDIAAGGLAGAGEKLPHLDAIQQAFGRHDVSSVRAQVGGKAAEAADELGAEAYATGAQVAFSSTPDLHTAAHEAAHTVQQLHGVAEGSDWHERHADQVADAVVRGESAEGLLDSVAAHGSQAQPAGAVQRKAVQRKAKAEITGRLVSIQSTSEGVKARYDRGTGAGIEPGWSVKLADGSTHEISVTTARESTAFINSLTYDEVMAKGRQATFVPPSKSRKQRRLERKAQTVPVSMRRAPTMTNEEGQRARTKVRIDRGGNDRFNWYWKVQLLNLDGSPRMFGEVVDVQDDHSLLEFPIYVTAINKDTQIRLIPYQ